MSLQGVTQSYIPLPQDLTSANAQAQPGPSTVDSAAQNSPARAAALAGVDNTPPTAAVSAHQASQPDLPDVENASRGSGSTRDAAAATIAWLQLKPFHLTASLDMLGDAARDNAISAGNIRRAASSNEYTAMNAAAADQIAEVEGERKSAITTAVGSVAGAVFSVGAGALGASGSVLGKGLFTGTEADIAARQAASDAAHIAAGKTGPAPKLATQEQRANIQGAALTAGGNAIGTMVNQVFALSDKFYGGQHDADEAKIAKATQDILVAAYKSRDDEFNSQQQNAQQGLGNVLSELRKEINTNLNDTSRGIIQNT